MNWKDMKMLMKPCQVPQLCVIVLLFFLYLTGFSSLVYAEKVMVRKPQGAGFFYPKDEVELYTLVDKLFEDRKQLNLPGVHSVLVPHAGYVYSGDVAASSLGELVKGFERVFILAANHRGDADFAGVSLPPVDMYEIPGAQIPLSPVVEELQKHPLFVSVPLSHTAYMIEVELPFLHTLAGRKQKPSFSIVPMIAGKLDRKSITQLAEVLNHYADDKTVFVFSVDLSHFYSYEKARRLDSETIDAILSRNMEALEQVTTDGNHVLMTMVELADLKGWDATLLKRKNSGDVTDERDRVVGYAGIAFHEPVRFSAGQQKKLLNLARTTIEKHLETGEPGKPSEKISHEDPVLAVPRGVFVTLKKEGELRGCIGDLVSGKPLYEGVGDFAVKAATQDPRFKPVTRDELDALDLSISVLEYPRRMKVSEPRQYPKMLKPGQDGVILVYKGRSSTYLPQVWDDLPDPVQFLSRLCLKQGAQANCWLEPDTVIFKYSAYEFGEK